jgi:beta-lactamase class A
MRNYLKRNIFAVSTIILLIVSIFLSYQLFCARKNEMPTEAQDKYPLLAKRIFLENPNDTIVNFSPLRTQIKDYLAKTGIPHSFYFEYLPTGTNIRDGETNELVGASLMKIPIVMDLYKAAELGKVDLDKQVTVTEEAVSSDGVYGNTNRLKPGDTITLRQAAKIALTESDNTAAYVVYSNTKDIMKDEELAIKSLDVELNEASTGTGSYVLISSRAYSSFLSCLYFSCHLNRENSQEILNNLAESGDNDRLRAGVPDNIRVARKIGSFSKQTQSDCGIVYVPNRQYAICLMLQSDDNQTNQHFKAISKMAYDYVTSVN